MRIGIIAMGRSGGYNLGEWISYELGYPYKHEPILNELNTEGKDIVVKWLYAEWNTVKELPQMDKWIGLWRENIRECAISHTKSYQTGEWKTEYTITDEWIHQNKEKINEVQKAIQFGSEDLVKIPQLESIVTYEGIYERGNDIQKVIDYLGIKEPKYLHLLDSSMRLRKDKRNKPKRLI